MMLIGAVGTDPDRTRVLAGCLILFIHFLAWLLWMLVYSWRKQTAYLAGGYRCLPHPRDTNPTAFWSIMTFYSLLIVLSLGVIGFSIIGLAHGGSRQTQVASHRPSANPAAGSSTQMLPRQ